MNEVRYEAAPCSRKVESVSFGCTVITDFLPRYQTAALDDETAAMIKGELFSRIDMLDILWKALLGSGVAVFLVCSISYCMVRRNDNQSKLV